ncbi:MAG TPA: DinB family protein [Candidatus Angelobacter sp.]|nr:DinB family protein [Candidatus Angelobacter sp.]
MNQSLSSEQALLLREIYFPSLERETETTRRVIEAIPADKGDFRPDAVSKTALELAWHIAASEKRFLNGIADGGFDFSPITRPETVKNSADITRWYSEMTGAVLPRLKQISGEQLSKSLDFRGMFAMPAVMFFQMTMMHSAHHRGQLSTYLRPMGGKVPAIYGESYDSAEARKAAQK